MSLHEHICDNCDAPVARAFCTSCHMYLCSSEDNDCDGLIHEPRAKRAHRRKQIGGEAGGGSQAGQSVIEIIVGANALPHLPTLTETDPLITLSVMRTNQKAGGAEEKSSITEYEYLDRTELQRDEHNPWFSKSFILDFHAEEDLYLKLDVYDGDVAHHHRSFHFPHEKDLIGTAHVRLNDCLIDQAGQQVVGFHPHHERDQNRFFYQLSNPVNAEVAHSLAEKESTVWLEAHVVSSEMYEQEKAAGLVNVKVTDGLKQSENAKLAVKHALIARSRAGSRIVSKKSSPGTSQASLLLGLPGGSPTNGSSMSMSTIGSSHSSNPSKRMSVPEEAAEKMMAAALAAAAKRDLEDSDAEDANRRGGEDSDDLDSEAEAERDEQRAASGNIHYLPSEHLFKADQPGNAALTSTIKHLLGRVQNLEWAVKKQRKQQNTASASAGAAVAQPSGLPLPVESPPDESATLHFKPNNTSSGTPANGTAAAGAGAGGVDPASIAKLVSSYESLLVSNHKLVLQVSDLAQTVQSQSAELKALQLTVAAQAQLSAANGSNGGSGLGSPMSPNRKGNSITPRPYTASSPTERWYSK